MLKLRGLLRNAKLEKLTKLKPKVRNNTRWSSTYEMLRRYVQLREFLAKLDSDTMHYFLLSSSESRLIDS